MEELLELKSYILKEDYRSALTLVEEMEEMSREDKLNRIDSFLVVLLLHLITQDAENRTTSSWDLSIYNAVREIHKTNKRRKAGGFYLDTNALREAIDDAYPAALKNAAAESFGGQFGAVQMAGKVDAVKIKAKALQLLTSEDE